MKKQNFYSEQIVGVAELMELQTSPETSIKDALVSVGAKGVLNGCSLQPTSPQNSLAVVVSTGKICLEDGSIVNLSLPATLDLSTVGVVQETGHSLWIGVYAIPTTVDDTPVITPANTTINYRTYDSVAWRTVVGVEGDNPGKPTATPEGYMGVLLGYVRKTYNQSLIVTGDIDNTSKLVLFNMPQLLAMIKDLQSHQPPFAISDINGLQGALDYKTNLGHHHYTGEIIGLDDILALKAALVHQHDVSEVNGLMAFLVGKLTLNNFNGRVMTVTSPGTVDNVFEVAHSLGRTPTAYIVLSQSAAGSLYGLPNPGSIHYESAGQASVYVDSRSAPWYPSGVNADHPYTMKGALSITEVPITLVGGNKITVDCLSGTVSAGSKYPYSDAAGYFPLAYDSYYPSQYMSNISVGIAGLCGAFVDMDGKIVQCVGIGRSAQFVVPSGAVKLQLGINDDTFSDNAGGFQVRVAAVQAAADPAWDNDHMYFKSDVANATFNILVV